MLKKLALGILLIITIFAPLGGIWDSISGTTKVNNDTELVQFINRHGDRGKSFTQIEIDHDSNMSPRAMRLVLTPKGRFAVLKDGLLTGLVTGISFVGLAYFWRADFSKKESWVHLPPKKSTENAASDMAILIFVLVFAGLFGISVLKDMFPDMSIYVATAIAFSPFYLLLAYIARGAYRNVHSELKANTNINPALLPLVTIGALIAFVIGGALIAFIISIGIVSIWILLEKLFSKPAPKDK